MNIRELLLSYAYNLFPFSLKGDCRVAEGGRDCRVSCIINFYSNARLMRTILACLSEQTLPKESFEVILVEDRGGTDEGRSLIDEYGSRLKINYYTLSENFGTMGYSRNYGLEKSNGEYILFLDDDTVILDGEFLTTLISEFESTGADALMPYGSASYSMLREKYNYHDRHFPTNRCMAYRRETLGDLCGFVSEIIGQEDVELTVRMLAGKKKVQKSYSLEYMHPPFILKSLNKAAAVGLSFARLRDRYPFVVWMMLLLNGCRYLPLLLVPINMELRTHGRFSLGFLMGIWYAITGKDIQYN